MCDGSGSWGTGVEAACWFRDWLATNCNAESRQDITENLRLAIQQLPSTITDDAFHWSFCIVAAIVTKDAVEIGACGRFTAVAHKNSNLQPLLTPTRLIDELVAQGHVSESDAEDHKYANVLCGPFFGVDDQTDLIWIQPQRLAPDSQVLNGGTALGRYLASCDALVSFTDPQSLHDAVEAFSGRSAPTAIITSNDSG